MQNFAQREKVVEPLIASINHRYLFNLADFITLSFISGYCIAKVSCNLRCCSFSCLFLTSIKILFWYGEVQDTTCFFFIAVSAISYSHSVLVLKLIQKLLWLTELRKNVSVEGIVQEM